MDDKERVALADELEQAAKHKSYWSSDDALLVLRAAAALRTPSGHGGGTVTEDYDSAAILATGKRLLQRPSPKSKRKINNA